MNPLSAEDRFVTIEGYIVSRYQLSVTPPLGKEVAITGEHINRGLAYKNVEESYMMFPDEISKPDDLVVARL